MGLLGSVQAKGLRATSLGRSGRFKPRASAGTLPAGNGPRRRRGPAASSLPGQRTQAPEGKRGAPCARAPLQSSRFVPGLPAAPFTSSAPPGRPRADTPRRRRPRPLPCAGRNPSRAPPRPHRLLQPRVAVRATHSRPRRKVVGAQEGWSGRAAEKGERPSHPPPRKSHVALRSAPVTSPLVEPP